MEDGILLESVEGLGNSLFTGTGGEIWEALQGEKEAVALELLGGTPLLQPLVSSRQEGDPSDEVSSEIEWLHRGQLESRLREIVEAQDRLLDGNYGRCADCGEKINSKRLVVNPAVALCLNCQELADRGPRAIRL